MRLTRRTFLALLVPAPLAAQEFVSVDGPLSDEDFYRLVACAAPPGGDCAKPVVRWPDPQRLSLRVGIAGVHPAFPSYKLDLVDQALDAAIDEINALGAHLWLDRHYAAPFDIPVYLLETPEGGLIQGTGNSQIDGSAMSIGRVVIRSRGADIQSAAIAISRDIHRREIASVVLEELVQALGLPTDISSGAYRRSIFSEEGNSVVYLRGQDAEAIRLHYPRA
ncbi:DUF2927 domain-containing protein [Rhodobacterales bacterium HKCCE2091]|nr:DUF2927 domain-containing protein [Rhodobacterales bacterium HKCCE2091]